MTGSDIVGLSASEIAVHVKDGRLSAIEAVEAHVRRIEAVNGALNAVVVPLFDSAIAEARIADDARARGEMLGPLHGVPITVKESLAVAGTAATAGIDTRTDVLAQYDNPLVARLKDAGAIVVGKTNLSQLLWVNEADNPVFGRTNNPWDLERTPGGSSGGEAAIIAASGSTMGLGSDGGGSIRFPAHFCGVHCLKPTSCRLPADGTVEEAILGWLGVLLAQLGPLARRVGDLRLASSILGTPTWHTRDPMLSMAPLRDPDAVAMRGLRVAVYVDDGYFRVSPAVSRATLEAVAALGERGAHVEEFRPPDVMHAMRLFWSLYAADGGATARRLLVGSRVDPQMRRILRTMAIPNAVTAGRAAWARARGRPRLAETLSAGMRLSGDGLLRLLVQVTEYRAKFMASMDAGGFDVIVCPPFALPAPGHGDSIRVEEAQSYSELFNLLGMPAGVVAATRVRSIEETDRPARKDPSEHAALRVEAGSSGMPVGVQVAGRHWREDVVLGVMSCLEDHFRSQPEYPAAPPIDC